MLGRYLENIIKNNSMFNCHSTVILSHCASRHSSSNLALSLPLFKDAYVGIRRANGPTTEAVVQQQLLPLPSYTRAQARVDPQCLGVGFCETFISPYKTSNLLEFHIQIIKQIYFYFYCPLHCKHQYTVLLQGLLQWQSFMRGSNSRMDIVYPCSSFLGC